MFSNKAYKIYHVILYRLFRALLKFLQLFSRCKQIKRSALLPSSLFCSPFSLIGHIFAFYCTPPFYPIDVFEITFISQTLGIDSFKWLTIEQLIELETVKVVYKALHNEAPPYLEELFLKLSNTQCRELRNSSTDLNIPRLRTSMGQKSFGYRGVRFWNNLIV